MTFGNLKENFIMHYSLKKFTVGIAVLAVIVFALSYAAFAAYEVKILINGEELACSQAPVIKDGRALVPLRDIFEKLGAVIFWNESDRSASALWEGVALTVYPDSGELLKNGEQLKLDIEPVVENGRIMVPLRAISESLGYNVIWNGNTYTVSISTAPVLKTHVLDCNQADSIFIELPEGKCMLIDAGEGSFAEKLESYIRNLGYSHIDYVAATHPHSDHIGGMAHVLKSFSVGTFYMPEVSHTTKTYENMLDALLSSECNIVYVSTGTFIADDIYDIVVLSPQLREYARMNNYSAVIKLEYNDVSMVFSADAEAEAENDMVNSGLDISADILKVGHHGSATSSTKKYLDAVNPEAAIISVGRGNPYGFPSYLVKKCLDTRGTEIYRTDTDGNICVTTDGYVYIIEGDK